MNVVQLKPKLLESSGFLPKNMNILYFNSKSSVRPHGTSTVEAVKYMYIYCKNTVFLPSTVAI